MIIWQVNKNLTFQKIKTNNVPVVKALCNRNDLKYKITILEHHLKAGVIHIFSP